MNDGQRAHVEERLRDGASQEEMVQYLMSEGVSADIARQGVADVQTSLGHTTKSGLPTVSSLLHESWQFVTSRTDLVAWYVVISFVPMVAMAGLVLLGYIASGAGSMAMVIVSLLGLLALFAVMWFIITASAGLFFAVAHGGETRFKDGFAWARPLFWQILVLGLLTGLVFFTGAIAFVIPVLILFVYCAFYFLEFMRHERRGLHALAASTQLVYGRFWSVAGRLAAMLLIVMATNIVLTVIFGLDQEPPTAFSAIGEIISLVVSFFLMVLFMRYLAQLHAALVASAEPYVLEPLSQSYKLYRVLAWIGGIALILTLLLATALVAAPITLSPLVM